MKRTKVLGLSIMTLGVLAAAGCNPAEDDASGDESAVTQGEYDFALKEGDQVERLDFLGVPLLGTILANKDRDLKGRPLMELAQGNVTGDGDDESPLGKALRRLKGELAREVVTPYRTSAPYVATPFLVALFDVNFMKLHGRWADSLRDAGYTPCSVDLGIANPVGPCTLQEAIDENGKKLGRVAQLLVPDYLTVNVDEAAGFPNGRTPDDPVGDYILALGFLKMGAPCPDGKPCNLKTFAKLKHKDGSIGTNPPRNDRKTWASFPYLATPWFYWDGNAPYERDAERLDVGACTKENSAAGKCPYWPMSERKKAPGPPGTRYAAPDDSPTVPTKVGKQ